jgi:bacterioferritin-associated ferredoxin
LELAMYVCICSAVTDRAIEQAARCGARNVDELGAQLGVGTGCGCCRELAADLLARAHQAPAFEVREARRLAASR